MLKRSKRIVENQNVLSKFYESLFIVDPVWETVDTSSSGMIQL